MPHLGRMALFASAYELLDETYSIFISHSFKLYFLARKEYKASEAMAKVNGIPKPKAMLLVGSPASTEL